MTLHGNKFAQQVPIERFFEDVVICVRGEVQVQYRG